MKNSPLEWNWVLFLKGFDRGSWSCFTGPPSSIWAHGKEILNTCYQLGLGFLACWSREKKAPDLYELAAPRHLVIWTQNGLLWYLCQLSIYIASSLFFSDFFLPFYYRIYFPSFRLTSIDVHYRDNNIFQTITKINGYIFHICILNCYCMFTSLQYILTFYHALKIITNRKKSSG